MEIRPLLTAELPAIQLVFREYAATIGSAICFQSFDAEVVGLPGLYAPPAGCILVAVSDTEIAGCVALRPSSRNTCEMKRLYVRPAFRRTGLGRSLTEKGIEFAIESGYRALRLDTLPSMSSALALYRSLGFQPIPPYGDNPTEALCFELTWRALDEK